MYLNKKKKKMLLYLFLTIKNLEFLNLFLMVLNIQDKLDFTKKFFKFLKKKFKRKKILLKKFKYTKYLLKKPNVFLDYNLLTNTGGIYKKKFWDKKYKYKNITNFSDAINDDFYLYKWFLLKKGKLRKHITEWNGAHYRKHKLVRSVGYQRVFIWPYLITIKPKLLLVQNIYFTPYFSITKHNKYAFFGFMRECFSKIKKWKRNIGSSVLHYIYNKYFFYKNNIYYRIFNLNADLKILSSLNILIKKTKSTNLYFPNLKEYKQLKNNNWKRIKRFNILYRRLLKKAFIGYTYFIRFYCIYFFWYLFYYNKFYFYYNKILYNLWWRFYSIVYLFDNISNNLFNPIDNKLFWSYNLLYKNLSYLYNYIYYFELEHILYFYLKSYNTFYYKLNNNKMIIQDLYACYRKYIYVIFSNYYNWYYNYNIYYNSNIFFKSILNKRTKTESIFFDFYYKTNYKCKVLYNIEYFSVLKYIARKRIFRKKKNILQIIKKNTNILLL